MIFSNIKDYQGGWFIGNFEPTIVKSPQFEGAYHTHFMGEKSEPHIHKLTTELNFIVYGELIVSGKRLSSGDIWIYEPNEISDVEFLSVVGLFIIRWPSIPGDKYII